MAERENTARYIAYSGVIRSRSRWPTEQVKKDIMTFLGNLSTALGRMAGDFTSDGVLHLKTNVESGLAIKLIEDTNANKFVLYLIGGICPEGSNPTLTGDDTCAIRIIEIYGTRQCPWIIYKTTDGDVGVSIAWDTSSTDITMSTFVEDNMIAYTPFVFCVVNAIDSVLNSSPDNGYAGVIYRGSLSTSNTASTHEYKKKYTGTMTEFQYRNTTNIQRNFQSSHFITGDTRYYAQAIRGYGLNGKFSDYASTYYLQAACGPASRCVGSYAKMALWGGNLEPKEAGSQYAKHPGPEFIRFGSTDNYFLRCFDIFLPVKYTPVDD